MQSEQTMRILDTLGIWFAGLGTFTASGIALWLALRSEKVKLNVYVGLRLLFRNHISEECLIFHVTNLGERPVTVNSIGWRLGKRKNREFAIQPVTHSSQDKYPKKIEHGEQALFMVDFIESQDWIKDFVERFILNKPIETLRAEIHTSVGYTKVIKPEKRLLMKLREAQVNLSKSVGYGK